MGMVDGENATLAWSPQWTTCRWPSRSATAEGDEQNDSGRRESGSDSGEDRFQVDNRSFLDTETLCSHSGNLHSREPLESRPQTDQSHHPPEPDANDTINSDETQQLGDLSFLFSRPRSMSAMSMTTAATMDVTANTHPASTSSPCCPWHQEQQIDLRLPSGPMPDDSQRSNHQQYHDFLNEIDSESLLPGHTLSAADRRPSSSRSHLLQWRRNKSPDPDSPSDGRSPTPDTRLLTIVTREEFESLPATIQRKYFSTSERSQFAHHSDLERHSRLGSAGHDQQPSPRSSLHKSSTSPEHQDRPATSDPCTLPSDRQPRITSTDQRFYANLPEKIKRRHLTEEELLIAHDKQDVAPGASEQQLDQNSKGLLQDPKMQSPYSSPALSDGQSSFPSIQPRPGDPEGRGPESMRSDSFYDSFRWLDDEEGLDLRLYLDDYHINLREEVTVPNRSRKPSFRRHLSVNKLPFGRPSVSHGRPVLRDSMVSPTFISPSASHSSGLSSPNHVRRKSRALSLVSANKQALPHSLTPVDPAATHYQDPEARQKLRAYLASPQKFDEAIEFGFPSQDGMKFQPQRPTLARDTNANKEGAHGSEKLRSFLADDQSSIYSDDASAAEPESPKTPQLFDKATTPDRTTQTSTEQPACPKVDKAAQDQAYNREMTLRMTLTRPDLRQSEEQIYGWKQPGGSRAGPSRDESTTSPAIYARDSNPKESIDKQLPTFDQWGDCPDHDNGVVKRFWNRVKRT
ncbi:hypothetical protein FZEAL_63 [Fusarium zealandicum]|uniref:Mucin n=1 Tax=Fusarium zealandicum TaxID=1053134 RepID=A0A8H4XQ70_9HYPO|nr:hypothetical protein FZEAL_63 [Fusarium zealandicum]